MAQAYWGSSIQQWGLVLFIILGGVIPGRLAYSIFKNVIGKLTKKTKTRLDDIRVDMMEEPVFFLIILGGIWFALDRLTLVPSSCCGEYV